MKLIAYLRRHYLGLIAILIALSGTAWAAATIGPRDIKKDAVRGKHVKTGEIGTSEVANDSLSGNDVDESTLKGARDVHHSGRIAVTDPGADFPTATTEQLVQAGAISILGRCLDEPSGSNPSDSSTLLIASDQPYRWVAHATHVQSGSASAQSPQGSDTAVTGETQIAFLAAGGITQLRMVEFSVVADSGDALAGTATITRQSGNPQCSFSVSAIG